MKTNTDEKYMDIPEVYSRRQLNAMYREIPLKDTTSRLLRKYFNAMANLYGIIPLRKAWDIISSLDPELVSKEEFLAFAEIARHECEDHCIMKDSELYLDGKPTGPLMLQALEEAATATHTPKVGRNDPCPCGSGKKYKRCCGR